MKSSLPFLSACALSVAACQTSERFEVTDKTIAPKDSLSWLGEPSALQGEGALRRGEPLPAVDLVSTRMETKMLANTGHVQVISTIPSIDTPVCDQQAHIMGENKLLRPEVQRIAISLDLPYAQRRFAEEAKLTNVDFYSDYRGGAFAKATGLQIARNGLLARAVIVVDRKGLVQYVQIVPEITQLPDMEKAFAVANALVDGGK